MDTEDSVRKRELESEFHKAIAAVIITIGIIVAVIALLNIGANKQNATVPCKPSEPAARLCESFCENKGMTCATYEGKGCTTAANLQTQYKCVDYDDELHTYEKQINITRLTPIRWDECWLLFRNETNQSIDCEELSSMSYRRVARLRLDPGLSERNEMIDDLVRRCDGKERPLIVMAFDAGELVERERVIEILQRRQIGIVANLPVSARTNSAHIREEFRMQWQHMISEVEHGE